MSNQPTITLSVGAPVMFNPWGPLYDALDGAAISKTATDFTLVGDHDARVVFFGDLTLDNGEIVGGTVTGFKVFFGSTETLSASNYAISATTLIDALDNYQNGDTDPFWDLTYNIPLVQVGSSLDDEFWGNGHAGKIFGGKGNDHLWGSEGSEVLDGGAGNDILSGGAGFDKLKGGAGRDVFFFADENQVELFADQQVDKVLDFQVGKDLIGLDLSSFEALGGGVVDREEFAIGKATTAHQHLIYVKATGALLYDEDGNGGVDAVQIATLSSGLHLTANSFFVDGDLVA